MKYVGSKRRLAKEIAPILQNAIDNWGGCKGYIEPFVGGANMICNIRCDNRVGYDSHKYLIALLKHIQESTADLPLTYDEEFYNQVRDDKDAYPDWLVGLVGFSTFGAKWFGGYPRGFKNDGITPRNIVNESIRNLKAQAPLLNGIEFNCIDFREIDELEGYVIYCDPPYQNSLRYSTSFFPYDEFYNWCRRMSNANKVFISEYAMPDDFKCIWTKEIKCTVDKASRTNRTEKLFTL